MRRSSCASSLLALATLAVAGCSTGRNDPTLRGHYVWGAEVNTFAPCGSDQVYWVSAADTARFRLQREYEALTTRAYEPVFMELAGEVGPVPERSRDGFPGDYDGWITLSWIGEIRAAGDEDCP